MNEDIDTITRAINRMEGFVDEVEQILCHAFGVDRFEQIHVRFTDHIPHFEVVVPLMRAMGGRWQALLADMAAFTYEQKAKLPGAGAGVMLDDEGKKAVSRA